MFKLMLNLFTQFYGAVCNVSTNTFITASSIKVYYVIWFW